MIFFLPNLCLQTPFSDGNNATHQWNSTAILFSQIPTFLVCHFHPFYFQPVFARMFRCVCVKSINLGYEVILKIQPVSLWPINYLCVCVRPCPWSLIKSALQKCLLNVELIPMARMKTQGKECCHVLGMDYTGGQCCGEHGLNIGGGPEAQGGQMTCSRSHSPEAPQGLCFLLQGHCLCCNQRPFCFCAACLPACSASLPGPKPSVEAPC